MKSICIGDENKRAQVRVSSLSWRNLTRRRFIGYTVVLVYKTCNAATSEKQRVDKEESGAPLNHLRLRNSADALTHVFGKRPQLAG